MRCSMDELRQKEVIDLRTGEKLGYIDDIDLDVDRQTVRGYLIYGRRYFFGMLRREADLFIPCSSVRLYGKDVILTEETIQMQRNAQNHEFSTVKFRDSQIDECVAK